MSGTTQTNGPFQGIPYLCPPGVPAELVPIIQQVYTTFQNLVQTLVTYGGLQARSADQILLSDNDPTAFLSANVHRFYCEASQNLLQGSPINLYSLSGTKLVAQLASAADNTKPCHGYCSNSGGCQEGSIGEVVIGSGMITTLAGLTIGTPIYLGTAAGSYTETPPSGGSTVVQQVGFAISSTSLLMWLGSLVGN